MRIISPQPRISQPRAAIRIDWTKPLTRGLVFAFNAGSGLVDLVSQKTLTTAGSVVKQVDSSGVGIYTAASADVAYCTLGQSISTTGSVSVFELSKVNNTTIARKRSFRLAGATGSVLLHDYSDAVNPYDFVAYQDTSSAFANIYYSAYASNQLYASYISHTASSALPIFDRSGTPATLSGQSGNGTRKEAITSVYIGNHSSLYPLTGKSYLCLVFNRTLSAAEQASLRANPWQIFQPDRKSIYYDFGINTPQILRPTSDITTGVNSDIQNYGFENTILTRQPQNLVGIDWSNPITKGLKFATNHSSPYIDLVSKTVGIKGGTIRNTINSNFKITEASDKSSYINWNLKPLIDDSSGITLLLFAKCLNEGVKSRAFVIGSESAGQGNNAAQIVFNATNTHGDSAGLFDVCEYQTSFVSSTQSIGGAVDGKFNLWVCRREKQTNTWSIFKNGINVSSGSIGTAGVFTFSSGVRLHGAPVSTTQGLSYPIIMSSIFGRYLTDYEILSLSKNPWQIFKSTPQIIPYTTPALGWGSTKNIYAPKQKVVSTQPQNLIGIDWSNPITKGMEFCYLPGILTNLVNRTSLATRRDTNTKTLGTAIYTPGTATTNGVNVTNGSGKLLGPLQQSSLIAFSSTTAGLISVGSNTDGLISTNGNAIYSERAASGNDIYKLCWSCDSNALTLYAEFTYRNDGGTLLQHRINIGRKNNGIPIFSAVTKNGTAHYVYCAGLGASGTFGSSSTAFTDAGLQRLINADLGDGTASWNGVTYFVIGFSRTLSINELNSLNKNPWQLFKSQEPPNFYSGFGSSLYETIDDPVTDDTDYIQATDNSTCEIKLDIGSRPTEDMLKQLKYRILPGTGNLTASLVSGLDIIATWDHVLTNSPQDITKVLTLAQHQSISEYSDLRIRLTPWQ